MIIDGRKIAAEIISRLKSHPEFDGLARGKQKKFFGAVLVGEDPASINFLKQKEKAADELGIEFRLYKLPASLTTDDLRREIARLASPKNCGGFIVQLPLPEGINKHYVLNAIPKEKDPDLLSEPSLGAFYTGRGKISPPSVGATHEVFKILKRPLKDLSVVLMGAGFLIGKPIGFSLQDKVAELTVIKSGSEHLRKKLHGADIVISGAGVPNLFSAGDLKDGAFVIDFGFSKLEGKTTGDFNPRGAEAKNISYTPTPGGTGPILVAKLFENFYTLNRT